VGSGCAAAGLAVAHGFDLRSGFTSSSVEALTPCGLVLMAVFFFFVPPL
jgi:hypothetical protein